MAKIVSRALVLKLVSSSSLFNRARPPFFFFFNPKTPPLAPPTIFRFNTRLFCSSSSSSSNNTNKINTKVNFSISDSDEDEEKEAQVINQTQINTKPYDPFSKKPIIVKEEEDPKNLQEIFHKMRSTDGMLNHAVKMFDALSKDGLTHEALQLFSQIKDKGNIPDIVSHTAVIEAYVNAGLIKQAHKVYLRMLACGVMPNAYTYTVLIKGLASDPDPVFLNDAKNYLLEMMGKGLRPNAGTYTAVFEAFAMRNKVDEAREFLGQMQTVSNGFVPNEMDVKQVMNTKRGPLFRTVISILFNK